MKQAIFLAIASLFFILTSCDKDYLDCEEPYALCLDEAVGDYSTDQAAAKNYTFSLLKNTKGGDDNCGDGHCDDTDDVDFQDDTALKVTISQWDEANFNTQYLLNGQLKDACTSLELPEQTVDGHTWKGEFSRTDNQLSGTLYMDGTPVTLTLTKSK